MKSRSRRLGLATVALSAILSGCAERIKSDLPTQMSVPADLQGTDGGPAVSTSDVEAARAVIDAAGPGLCHSAVAASQSPLRRDAFGRARIVGHVIPGEKLTFFDFIDRRLRILGRVVFDGGYWHKVRGQHGDVGWLPAADVREVRGPCEAGDVALSGEWRAPEQGGP